MDTNADEMSSQTDDPDSNADELSIDSDNLKREPDDLSTDIPKNSLVHLVH